MGIKVVRVVFTVVETVKAKTVRVTKVTTVVSKSRTEVLVEVMVSLRTIRVVLVVTDTDRYRLV